MHFIFNLLRLPSEKLSVADMLRRGYAVLTHPNAHSIDCLHALKTAEIRVDEIVSCNPSLPGRRDIFAQRGVYRAIKRGHVSTIVKHAFGDGTQIDPPVGADASAFDLSPERSEDSYIVDEGRDNYLEKTGFDKLREIIFSLHLGYVRSFQKNLYLPYYNAYFLRDDLVSSLTLLDSPSALLPNIEQASEYLMEMSGVCIVSGSPSVTLYQHDADPLLLGSFPLSEPAATVDFFKAPLVLGSVRVFFCKDPAQISLISKYIESETFVFLLDEMYAPTEFHLSNDRRFILRPSSQLHALYLTSIK